MATLTDIKYSLFGFMTDDKLATGAANISPVDLQLISDALVEYAGLSALDLANMDPFSQEYIALINTHLAQAVVDTLSIEEQQRLTLNIGFEDGVFKFLTDTSSTTSYWQDGSYQRLVESGSASGIEYKVSIGEGDVLVYEPVEPADPVDPGTAASETLLGTAASEDLFGDSGDDVLYGFAGSDRIDGGAGSDTAVYSGNRNDYTVTELPRGGVILIASTTNSDGVDVGSDLVANVEYFRFDDGIYTLQELLQPIEIDDVEADNNLPQPIDLELIGTSSSDTLLGGVGDDTLNGGGGNDVIDGGSGVDTGVFGSLGQVDLSYDESSDTFTVTDTRTSGLNHGSDIVRNVEVFDFAGKLLEVEKGTSAGETLSGSNGHDLMLGGAGNDALHGKCGWDVLFGGEGDDLLSAGGGFDEAHGGHGDDHYVQYGSWWQLDIADQGSGHDTVRLHTDFAADSNGDWSWSASLNGDDLNIRFGSSASVTIQGGLTDSNGDGQLDALDANVIESFQFHDTTVSLDALLWAAGLLESEQLSFASASQSSTFGNNQAEWGAHRTIDGVIDGDSNFNHTGHGNTAQWLSLDLNADGSADLIDEITVYNRHSDNAAWNARLDGATVSVLNDGHTVWTSDPITGAAGGDAFTFNLDELVLGDEVRIDHHGQWLHVSEVEAFGQEVREIDIASASQSSTFGSGNETKYGAHLAIDGNTDAENNWNHTNNAGQAQWLSLMLNEDGSADEIVFVNLLNRDHSAEVAARLNGATVSVLNDGELVWTSEAISGAEDGGWEQIEVGGVMGDEVRIDHHSQWLHISEVDIFAFA